jgi:hypothetical protein
MLFFIALLLFITFLLFYILLNLVLFMQIPKPKLRTRNFTFKAEARVLGELDKLGFAEWLRFNQLEASAAATMRLSAEFVAFCKHRMTVHTRFVDMCLCADIMLM